MMETNQSVLTSIEPLQTAVAQPPPIDTHLSRENAEVRGKRILLVDDEPAIRVCLRMMLELQGHQVTEACDGVEALKSFSMSQFDLVVTDLEMPVMKGNKLAVGLKLLAPSVPILMITASPSARREPENPVDALLNKPFMVEDLHGAVRKLLSAPPEQTQRIVIPALDEIP
jgi:two-component system, cell cycle response regulator CpdR